MRAPQGCLRSNFNLARITLYTSASRLTSSRLSDYSLVKERSHKYLPMNNFGQVSLRPPRDCSGAAGRQIVSTVAFLSIGCREIFGSSRRPMGRPEQDEKAPIGGTRPGIFIRLLTVACGNRRHGAFCCSFSHHSQPLPGERRPSQSRRLIIAFNYRTVKLFPLLHARGGASWGAARQPPRRAKPGRMARGRRGRSGFYPC